jgi:hypothetical protein
MKSKKDREEAADKTLYIRPRVSIVQPEGGAAKRLSDAIVSGSPGTGSQVVAEMKTKPSKARRRQTPRVV